MGIPPRQRIALSPLLLKERLSAVRVVLQQVIRDPFQIAGAALILGAAFVGEVFGGKPKHRKRSR